MADMQMEQRFVIKSSPVMNLCFAVGSLFLCGTAINSHKNNWDSLLATIFAAITIYFIFCLLDHRPKFIIDKSGVNVLTKGYGIVPWADVSDFNVVYTRNYHYLKIKLRDPEKWLSKGDKLIQAIFRILGAQRFSLIVWLSSMKVDEPALITFMGEALATNQFDEKAEINYSFSFNTAQDSPDAEVINYAYGTTNKHIARGEKDDAGQALGQCNITGVYARGEFLRVKWRIKQSDLTYEDTVDLKSLLPKNIRDYRIHFVIKESQLYVYLISPLNRSADMPPGPVSKYRFQIQSQIYPDK